MQCIVRCSVVIMVPHLIVFAKNNGGECENKIQSEALDVASGAATWRTERNIRVAIDSGPFGPLHVNMTSSTKPEVRNVIYCLPSEEDRAMETGNTYRKFGEIWTRGFRDTHTGQTDT